MYLTQNKHNWVSRFKKNKQKKNIEDLLFSGLWRQDVCLKQGL